MPPDAPADVMWGRAFDLLARAERLHAQFFHLATTAHAEPAWAPPVDIAEDDDECVVVVAMPGVPADRVEVTLAPGVLRVRGSRPHPFTGGRHRVTRLELPYGAFERRIALPFAVRALSSELAHGVLVVRLAKA
jgi:HSP20 family molecular chaperone IbpA